MLIHTWIDSALSPTTWSHCSNDGTCFLSECRISSCSFSLVINWRAKSFINFPCKLKINLIALNWIILCSQETTVSMIQDSGDRLMVNIILRLLVHVKVTKKALQLNKLITETLTTTLQMHLILTSSVLISCCVSSALVAHCVLSPSKRSAEMTIIDCTTSRISHSVSWCASSSAITYIGLATEVPHIWNSANSPLLTLQITVFEVNTF
jgi:hypothetical protein